MIVNWELVSVMIQLNALNLFVDENSLSLFENVIKPSNTKVLHYKWIFGQRQFNKITTTCQLKVQLCNHHEKSKPWLVKRKDTIINRNKGFQQLFQMEQVCLLFSSSNWLRLWFLATFCCLSICCDHFHELISATSIKFCFTPTS